MANMELTPAESAEEGKEINDYKPRYAVSEIWLDEHALAALGLTDLPKPGTVVAVNMVAKVVAVSMRDDNAGGGTQASMTLQPTDMDVAPHVRKIDAKAMFPNSKMAE